MRSECILARQEAKCLLAVHKRLDVESEGGTDAHDILPVQFLENGRLPSIVETASLK